MEKECNHFLKLRENWASIGHISQLTKDRDNFLPQFLHKNHTKLLHYMLYEGRLKNQKESFFLQLWNRLFWMKLDSFNSKKNHFCSLCIFLQCKFHNQQLLQKKRIIWCQDFKQIHFHIMSNWLKISSIYNWISEQVQAHKPYLSYNNQADKLHKLLKNCKSNNV